jgi:hypothetical protein
MQTVKNWVKYFVLVFGLTLLFACGGNNQPNSLAGYKQKSVRLTNGLGIVSIYMPNEMDTFYSRVDFGEYHCAEVKYHRFVSKKYDCCLYPSSDFGYQDLSDSVYQLTIVQTYNKDCEQYITVNEDMMRNIQNGYLGIDKGMPATPKYYLTDINGRKFIIRELRAKINGMDYQELCGFTDADGRQVKFIFKCYSKYAVNFIERMLASMKTIQITADEVSKS